MGGQGRGRGRLGGGCGEGQVREGWEENYRGRCCRVTMWGRDWWG